MAVGTVAVTMAAGDYYRLASEQDPKDARSHYGLGVCRLHLQQYETGVEALERARVLASAAV